MADHNDTHIGREHNDSTDPADVIAAGDAILGIELGSTRIKAVLIGPDHTPIANGSHTWQNQYVDDNWTYPLEDVWTGLQACYADLTDDIRRRYDRPLERIAGLGVSAMMHGYLAFDADDQLLVPFRTWRNTNTGQAVDQLTEVLGQHIPHRWSIAHLHQAILDREPHVPQIRHLTTLAGYVHWQLTGLKVLGVGDASGMFPIDPNTGTYNADNLKTAQELITAAGAQLQLAELMPNVLTAGQDAGSLTAAGALLLDPTGSLQPGSPLCPPEGDAGTGMVATNSVAPRTGNVSAGTSIFAMVVLEHQLAGPHREIDLVTTPDGQPVAMVHCNNGASELDTWAGLFTELANTIGSADKATVFDAIMKAALDGDPDAGGLTMFNYLSGEPITGLTQGRPLILRTPDSRLTLANFTRAQLYSILATLRIGMNVLLQAEAVQLDRVFAHGGLFTTKDVAQSLLAASLNTRVTVGHTAGHGGAWGIALLAAYRQAQRPERSLAEYLDTHVFAHAKTHTIDPDPDDVAGFDQYLGRYTAALPVEESATKHV